MMTPPLLFTHRPSADPCQVYPPDLKRPLLAYRYSGDDLCGQVVVPFRHQGVPMAVDVFTDLRYDVRALRLMAEPLTIHAALYAWKAALDAVSDLRDRAWEKREEYPLRLYGQAHDALEQRVNEVGLALYEQRPSARRYGS